MYLTISNPENYHAALYIRLSKEDEKEGPSQSISNQKSLLLEFAENHCLSVYDTYVDDGFSGTSFDRPDFKRMIQDIEDHKVNMVITKDLSRLGRDYIMTGHYMERYFPEHDVRYISLLDGIDTGVVSVNNDITPFRAVMNDMYAKDISKKIKSVKRDKQQKGLFVGWKPPYGYKVYPDNKNKLMIDEPAAAVVRRVFSMALSGMSCHEIADSLNEEHVPTPSTYAGVAVGRISPNTGLWQGDRISDMLKNEVYTGNMVYRRTEKINYKTKKYSVNPPEKWLVVKNTHPPIVDENIFHSVAEMRSSKKATRDCKHKSPLKGLIYCRECGEPLTLINRPNAAGEDRLFFICRTYHRSGKARLCTCHSIKEQTVREAVLSKVQEQCSQYLQPEFLLPIAKQAIAKANQHDNKGAEIQSLENKLRSLSDSMDQVYMDKLSGLLDSEDFQRIYENLKDKQTHLTQKLEALQQERRISLEDADLLPLIQKHIEKFACSRELLAHLIDRIEFSEDKQLYIKFRCQDPNALCE